MTDKPTVLHLVDDTTAGGVMRVVSYIQSAPELMANARHIKLEVKRGKITPWRYDADIIVSHLTINWRAIPCLLAMRAANTGTPMVHVEHSYTEGFVAHNVSRRGRFATLLKVGFSLFDRIVAVSYAQSKWFAARGFCAPEKLLTIQSCVDLETFRDMPDPKGPVRVFGAIGRLDRQKGFDMLIKAFIKSPDPDIALHIYGEGEEELNLRALADGDPRIVFKGFAAKASQAYENIDVVVMTSRWEAYGLVAIEALSAGRQVLCVDVDGLRDHAAHGARLFQGTSTESLTALLSDARTRQHTSNKGDWRISRRLERSFVHAWIKIINQLTPHLAKPNNSCAVRR